MFIYILLSQFSISGKRSNEVRSDLISKSKDNQSDDSSHMSSSHPKKRRKMKKHKKTVPRSCKLNVTV